MNIAVPTALLLFPPGVKEYISHFLLASSGVLGPVLTNGVWPEVMIPLWDGPESLPQDSPCSFSLLVCRPDAEDPGEASEAPTADAASPNHGGKCLPVIQLTPARNKSSIV